MKCVVILNHRPTMTQLDDLARAGITTIIEPPDQLKSIWSNIPPDAGENEVLKHIRPIIAFCEENLQVGDLLWVQGEPFAQTAMVLWAYINHIVPIHATTERIVVEQDGVKTSRFEHKRFRSYPLLLNDAILRIACETEVEAAEIFELFAEQIATALKR